jgi:hypothetical protein
MFLRKYAPQRLPPKRMELSRVPLCCQLEKRNQVANTGAVRYFEISGASALGIAAVPVRGEPAQYSYGVATAPGAGQH